jgi:putative peptidoglycan lipid II flippase
VVAGIPSAAAVWAFHPLGARRLHSLLTLGAGGVVFVVVFVVVAKLLRIDEVSGLINPVLKKLHIVH